MFLNKMERTDFRTGDDYKNIVVSGWFAFCCRDWFNCLFCFHTCCTGKKVGVQI